MKKNESNFVTEVKLGEVIECDGPAKFTVLEIASGGHKNRAMVSVRADRTTRIKKLASEAAETAKKWELL